MVSTITLADLPIRLLTCTNPKSTHTLAFITSSTSLSSLLVSAMAYVALPKSIPILRYHLLFYNTSSHHQFSLEPFSLKRYFAQ